MMPRLRLSLTRSPHVVIGLATIACVLASPSVASAHLVSSGVGPFYDGVAHWFFSPADIGLVVALPIFAGLIGVDAARWCVVALPIGWLAGLLAGAGLHAPPDLLWLTGLTMLVAGLLAAAASTVSEKYSPALPALIAALLGALHGWLNGGAIAATDTHWTTGLGIVAALATAALLIAAVTTVLKAHWQRIAARVLGSWIAAIGLLACAWALRPTDIPVS